MNSDEGAEFFANISGEESLESAVWTIANFAACNFLKSFDESGIEGGAGSAQRQERNRGGIFGRGGDDAGAGPGGFASGLLRVEESDVQTGLGKFEGDACANQAATGDDCVVALHGCHSSAPGGNVGRKRRRGELNAEAQSSQRRRDSTGSWLIPERGRLPFWRDRVRATNHHRVPLREPNLRSRALAKLNRSGRS